MSDPSAVSVVFDVHTSEQRFRMQSVILDTPPMSVSDVPDVQLYMESLGLEHLQCSTFTKLPFSVLLLFQSHADRPALGSKAKREMVLYGGQPSEKCRLVYLNGFEPAVFARKTIRSSELIGVVTCEVMLHGDAPDDDATVWDVIPQPDIYAGPALLFCTRRAGNMFRFIRNARLTGRSANVVTRQVWVDGRPYMTLEAVER